jgi:hypothetical protein
MEAGKELGELPILFTAEDGMLTSGGVGFYSNYMSGVYFDNLQIEPLECYTGGPPSTLSITPPQCSRFMETYLGQFDNRWKTWDPENSQAGPSSWKFTKDLGDRDDLIIQQTAVYGPDHAPTFAYLDFDKECIEGAISMEFNSPGEGVVGLAFRFTNANNYYIFEVGGEEEGFK